MLFSISQCEYNIWLDVINYRWSLCIEIYTETDICEGKYFYPILDKNEIKTNSCDFWANFPYENLPNILN